MMVKKKKFEISIGNGDLWKKKNIIEAVIKLRKYISSNFSKQYKDFSLLRQDVPHYQRRLRSYSSFYIDSYKYKKK